MARRRPELPAERLTVTRPVRELMSEVVARLESSEEDAFLDAGDAVQVDCAFGGRVAPDGFDFTYLPDPETAWTFALTEQQVRLVADGSLEVVPAVRETHPKPIRPPETGDAILIWGEGPRDGLRLRSADQTRQALTLLRSRVASRPVWFRLWSRRDELLFGVVARDEWALQAVWPRRGYASSRGDDAQSETFEAPAVDGTSRQIPWSDCVDWRAALDAAVRFAMSGELGELPCRERVDGAVIRRAGGGRAGELQGRPSLPASLGESSLGE